MQKNNTSKTCKNGFIINHIHLYNDHKSKVNKRNQRKIEIEANFYRIPLLSAYNMSDD